MSYVKFNFTTYPRSVALGAEFENTTFSAPINNWNWFRHDDHISANISSFDPLFRSGLIEMYRIMGTLFSQMMAF